MAPRALSWVVSFFGPSYTTDKRWPGQRARTEVWSEGNVKPAPHWGVVCVCHREKHFSESWDSPKGICFNLLTRSLQAERELRPEPWLLATEMHFAELMGRERASQEKTQREGEMEEGRREGASENVPCRQLCLRVAFHYTCVILRLFYQTGAITPSKTNAGVTNYTPISFYSNTPYFLLPLK